MTNETVLQIGVPAFAVSANVVIGTLITLGSDGLWKLTAAGDEVFYVAQQVTTAASGTLVAGRYETIMNVLVDGTSDVAVGDDLQVDAGKLIKWTTGAKVGKAMEAVTANAATLAKVLFQK